MNTKPFPIMSQWSTAKHLSLDGFGIPWEMIQPHERQALKNHCGQNLEKLASRCGLSPCEAIAILEDREWERMDTEFAYNKLCKMRDEFRNNASHFHNP
jgi:hypothetical protein